MKKWSFRLTAFLLVIGLSLISLQFPPAQASDHTDTPLHVEAGRDDARLTDFWTFVQDGRLVLILGINPFLPDEVQQYVFPTDVTYSFFIDRNSRVKYDNPVNNAAFGGTVETPSQIREDVTFNVTFDWHNRPQVEIVTDSAPEKARLRNEMRIFTGLRAEAFIFAPFVKKNIAAIVIDVPLNLVKNSNNPLLLWTTSKVDGFAGPFQELAGRTLNSQFDEKLALNFIHPSQHQAALGLNPDLVILNPAAPSRFPNGRPLGDDIVDLVAALPAPFNDSRAFNLEFDLAQFHATVNDVAPTRNVFPYLANPNPH
ncbi:MAG TPA: hypothetical protein VJ302_00940 [Blastocatellia bacterium]|nr:hypothetical protein [Blastocatellia bacterium]